MGFPRKMRAAAAKQKPPESSRRQREL
jgi:hypothetical protein